MMEQKNYSHAWQSMVAIFMILSGCACFILAVIAAMITANKK